MISKGCPKCGCTDFIYSESREYKITTEDGKIYGDADPTAVEYLSIECYDCETTFSIESITSEIDWG